MPDSEQPNKSALEPQPGAHTGNLQPQNSVDIQPQLPEPTQVQNQTPIPQVISDRAELLARARSFLAAPHIRSQDNNVKRTFLHEKGLTDAEIALLLHELPPAIPPRTYPQPPPSNLPNLIIGLARIFTWLTGTSAILIFVYYRYLLPRLTHSYYTRHTLRTHQSALMTRLTESLASLKSTQASAFADLPRPAPFKEDIRYSECQSLDEIIAQRGRSTPDTENADIEDITLLRCALTELSRDKSGEDEGVSTEQLFSHLESKVSLLSGEEGGQHQSNLWNTLNTNTSLFISISPKDASTNTPEPPSRLRWTYVRPPPQPEPPVLPALDKLRASLPRPASLPPPVTIPPPLSATQRTLQALSDFTGYITTQTYSFSIRGGTKTDPQEDEIRRDIRALKGLVLNRRSFLPSGAPNSGSTTGGLPSVSASSAAETVQ
ncbi:hypothetical protein BJ138DRAFT_1053080 [Hygrophoropsis aurantiaca]|uniref:Uncharacterized protein n=1 Tax=Hygrophoropsis aurantiaca TaxID=72124 RepID=A0ACB8ASU8_9AGAM|nr:hypothetical protein BJ138DRAFT_1053080 [Hygrophoropsis aurantiaca]